MNIIEKFEEERTAWTEKVKSMSYMFRDITKLAELQVELFSNRQILIEYMHRLIAITGKMEKEIIENKRKTYDNYTRNFDYKPSNAQERELLISSDNAELLEKSHHVKSHVEFIRDTIKGIDNMIYGINNRIKLEEYKYVKS